MASEYMRSSEEHRHSLLSDTRPDLLDELLHWPSLPQKGPPYCELADFPSSGEAVCLYLENACFSISTIYIFYVQNMFIIKIFIIACDALHSTMYLGYIYQLPFISHQHIGWKQR